MDAGADQPASIRHRRSSHRRYWLHLYRRDVPAAEEFIQRCLRDWPAPRIYTRIFEPALNLSGTLFGRGAITYHDEHFVTYHTLRFIRQVRRKFVPPETTGPLAMAVSVSQESHQIGLRMVCDFLRWANWRVHWLSSNERGTLREALLRLRPDALLISLGLETSIEPARRLIAEIRRTSYPGRVIIGGRAVNARPALVHELDADLTAPNGPQLVRLLRPGRDVDSLL